MYGDEVAPEQGEAAETVLVTCFSGSIGGKGCRS